MLDKAKIKVFKGGDEEFYWHLVSRNGEIQCQGEGYTRREDAIRGIWNTTETVLQILGLVTEPEGPQVRHALYEAIEIIEPDGSVLTLEEAGYSSREAGVG